VLLGGLTSRLIKDEKTPSSGHRSPVWRQILNNRSLKLSLKVFRRDRLADHFVEDTTFFFLFIPRKSLVISVRADFIENRRTKV